MQIVGRSKSACFNLKPLGAALLAVSLLASCGGGGGGSTTTSPTENTSGGTQTGGSQTGGAQTGGAQTGGAQTGGAQTGGGGTPTGTVALPDAVPANTQMTMSCVDGANFQCSGSSILRVDNGVGLSSSGVQVYGKSTSDLATPNTNKTSASGFILDTGGTAEVRVGKDATGAITTPALLLSNFGLSWDGKKERPLIVETFRTAQARVTLAGNGALTFGTLPAPIALPFYDFATLGANGTQGNYANNSYFPRLDPNNPPRWPDDVPLSQRLNRETSGLTNSLGSWRSGGTAPDEASVARLHEDGDVHAGNSTTGGALPGGNGIGVPFPGSKGYRHFGNWAFQYANLASWTSQDTVLIEEWANLGDEHNKNRRGFVSYGEVSDPAAVPTTGTVTYSGIVYGWYGRGALEEPPLFHGRATVTVNFATRQVTVAVENTATHDAAETAVPATFTATTGMGAAGSNVANYLTGAVSTGTVSGGVSGRFFGPVVSSGTSGAGPAEIGGAFRMSNASGVAIIGGFIGRKQ